MPRKKGYAAVDGVFPGSEITAEEWEFIRAIEAYKRKHRRHFPAWTEVLAVLKRLGYRKPDGPPTS